MSGRKTILVTGTSLAPGAAIDRMVELGFDVRHEKNPMLSADELHKALDGVAGYLIGGDEKVLDEHFSQAESLEAVAWIGTDFKSNVPGWRRAFDLGISFVNVPGANARSVAEMTIAMILATARPAIVGARTDEPGNELYGRRLGLIGMGRIGALVARIARLGFEMSVAYYAPRRQHSIEDVLGVRYLDRATLLATSDVVSLHRPGPVADEAPELGAAEFALMKPDVAVINTVHSGLIDMDALADAMAHSRLRVAIDDQDVRPEHAAVWKALNSYGPGRFLAWRQAGYDTHEANARAALRAVESVCAVLDGRPAENVNNKDDVDR